MFASLGLVPLSAGAAGSRGPVELARHVRRSWSLGRLWDLHRCLATPCARSTDKGLTESELHRPYLRAGPARLISSWVSFLRSNNRLDPNNFFEEHTI